MPKVIKVESLSKAYQLGNFGTGTISRDLERFWAQVRGKEDPFLKIGETNDRTKKGGSNIVWSLRELNFNIQQGDAVGIIGRNGAGKSTLLKILSRVTSPTLGSVKIKGGIASLLEVGTGFHPELTGKENIFLNGAILGMRKNEIKRKFEEIVDFSGVERYIDTPVKRYSSGMYVRLAFAVAAHLESEILIVDEVLAVGDAEFQKKCLGKMGEVSKGEGRTVLFVSHNMGAVKNLCTRTILLNNGSIYLDGTVTDGLKAYTQLETLNKRSSFKTDNPTKRIKEIAVQSNDGQVRFGYRFDEDICLQILFKTDQNSNAYIGFKVFDQYDRCIFTAERKERDFANGKAQVTILIAIPKETLTPGEYKVSFAVHIPNIQIIELVNDTIYFEVLETGTDFYQFNGTDYGCVFVRCVWDFF